MSFCPISTPAGRACSTGSRGRWIGAGWRTPACGCRSFCSAHRRCSGQEFLAYRASHPVNTVVGAALALTLPLGEYQKDKLLNLGQNRFAIQPQLGVVHTRGPWSYELTGSVSFFTDNNEFLVDHSRAQDPVLLLQTHAVYADPRGWWASAGAAYDWGGASRVDGVAKDDYREDLLYGGAVGLEHQPAIERPDHLRRQSRPDRGRIEYGQSRAGAFHKVLISRMTLKPDQQQGIAPTDLKNVDGPFPRIDGQGAEGGRH